VKGPSTRQLVSQGVIVTAVSAGLSLGMLQPLKATLNAERAQLAADQSLVAQHQAMQVKQEDPERRARHTVLRTRLKELASPADSAASLHNTLMTLALEAGVTIEGVEPRQITVPVTAANPAQALPASPTNALSAHITGRGSYESIAAFLARLERTGLTRLLGGQLTPQSNDNGEPTARFTLTSVHFGFSVPAAPAQAMVTGGGS